MSKAFQSQAKVDTQARDSPYKFVLGLCTQSSLVQNHQKLWQTHVQTTDKHSKASTNQVQGHTNTSRLNTRDMRAKVDFKPDTGVVAKVKCLAIPNNCNWCKSLYHIYLKDEIHVLLGLGSLVEAIWINIDALATIHLAWVCTPAIKATPNLLQMQGNLSNWTLEKPSTVKWYCTAKKILSNIVKSVL